MGDIKFPLQRTTQMTYQEYQAIKANPDAYNRDGTKKYAAKVRHQPTQVANSNGITMYHGTKNSAAIVSVSPKATSAANGNGFYCTTDINVAIAYGTSVIAFDMTKEQYKAINPIVRPMANTNSNEHVFSQAQADEMVRVATVTIR